MLQVGKFYKSKYGALSYVGECLTEKAFRGITVNECSVDVFFIIDSEEMGFTEIDKNDFLEKYNKAQKAINDLTKTIN